MAVKAITLLSKFPPQETEGSRSREVPPTHQLQVKKEATVRQNREIFFVCLLISGRENARTKMFSFHLMARTDHTFTPGAGPPQRSWEVIPEQNRYCVGKEEKEAINTAMVLLLFPPFYR